MRNSNKLLLLQVTIEEARPRAGRDIHALVVLTNVSPFALTVNCLFQVNRKTLPHQISLGLKKAGRELPFLKKMRIDPTASEFQSLAPGRAIGRRIRLSDCFAIEKASYRLIATYRNDEDPPGRTDVRAWKGMLTAETSFIAS